jgi:hypothetical protein
MFSANVQHWRRTVNAEKCANPPPTRERSPDSQSPDSIVAVPE